MSEAPTSSGAGAMTGAGRERCMRWISVGAMINSLSWTVVTTAQLGLGAQLAPSRGHLVQMTALMRSAAQLTAFFCLPACGALSDRVGRRPVLVVRSFIVFLFSGLIFLRPRSYAMFLTHRFISNLTHHLTDATTNACVADLFQGQRLAGATASLRSQMGVAMLAGPALGGRIAEISFPLCFGISALCGLLNILVFGFVPETRDRAATSDKGRLRAVNPVSFLALFRGGRTLATLTLAVGISEMCDGTTEIDRYYAQEVVGLSLTQNGFYQSMRGAAMIVGGRLVKPALAALGVTRFTTMCNAAAAVHMLGKATARAPAQFFSALVPHVFGAGSYREAALRARVMQLALARGMSRGEVAASEANFRALLSTAAPFLYSTLYNMTRNSGGWLQGAPYYLCAGLLACSHLTFMTLPREELEV